MGHCLGGNLILYPYLVVFGYFVSDSGYGYYIPFVLYIAERKYI